MKLALAAVTAFALLILVGTMLANGPMRMLIEMLYLGLFAVSFNLLFNYAGMLSLGHNASYGVAGYTAAILFQHFPGMPLVFVFALTLASAAILSCLIGLICARLKGGYLGLMTLALCTLLYLMAQKARALTGGTDGMLIPGRRFEIPFVGSFSLSSISMLFVITVLVVVGWLALLAHLLRTPLGNAIILTRDNEERARFLGYNVFATRLAVFIVAGTAAGAAGFLSVLVQGIIWPETLAFVSGADVVFMTLIGGSGSLFGPLIGAAVFTLAEDRLAQITEHWRMFLGIVFLVMVLYAPTGITGGLRRLVGAPALRARWSRLVAKEAING